MGVASLNPLDLNGGTILVTGASSGIGRETAVVLSQLNAKVVLTGRNQERLEETLQSLAGEGHFVSPCDLDALDEVPKWLKGVTAKTGPLKGLVHSAGIHGTVPIRVLSAQKAEEMMRVNVSSAMMLARAFRQRDCYARDSSVVFLSSTAGLVGSPGLSAYAASKAALIGLTRALAAELAADGIRVNCVAPGFVKTEMFDRYAASVPPEHLSEQLALFPLGLGTPRDVAYGVAYLLAETGRWITGTTLVLDGGYSMK